MVAIDLSSIVPVWVGEKIDTTTVVLGIVVATGGLVFLKLAKILSLRSKRRQKKEEVRKTKETFALRLKSHEKQDAVQNAEKITRLSLEELVPKLQNRELKAVDTLLAFQSKASMEDQKYNFITEVIWEAEAEAMEKDMIFKTQKGPLHGVPVSVKDCFAVKGYDSCCGFSEYIGKTLSEDSVLVKVLKKQGAIPFIKTNVPQTMLSFDCDNAIHGQTVNVHDATRTSGGSSGGEAAAIVSHASVLGFGTDIGGSIRIPSSFSGCCGLKTTVNRISKKGLPTCASGNKLLNSTIGPLSRTVEGLAIAMRAILIPEMFEQDYDVSPLPFKEEMYQSKKQLKIGYYVEDDFFASAPASQRAVLLVKQKLEDMGHELVPYHISRAYDALYHFYIKALFGDGGEGATNLLKHDTLVPSVTALYYILRMPLFVKKMMMWLCRPFSWYFYIYLKGMLGCSSVKEWWNFTKEKEEWCRDAIADWKKNKLDAVICPSVGPALPIGYPGLCAPMVSYTCLFNLLNCPAGTVPVTKVTAEDEAGMKNFPTPNIWHIIVKKGLSQGTVGLPVSVQVVTLPWQEELCLRVMKDIETGCKTLK